MRPSIIACFTALMLLAISCKKENSTIQSSSITNESSTQTFSTETNVTGELIARNIRIGTQVWMTKNLNVSHYRNGDRIPQVNDPDKWAALTTGAWCWYNNDSANCSIYGKLYNWYAVHDPRGLAPNGWHIPSDAEWTTLTDYLGGESVAGGKMKSTGTIEAGTGLWHAPNTDATNSSGFTGLPGASRGIDGWFDGIGTFGHWWSSSEFNTNQVWRRSLFSGNGNIYREYVLKPAGFSVRCLRD